MAVNRPESEGEARGQGWFTSDCCKKTGNHGVNFQMIALHADVAHTY